MNKRKVTDEMVERFTVAMGWGGSRDDIREVVKCALDATLEAALDPSAEPEIPVTEDQCLAAWAALQAAGFPPAKRGALKAVYRAMRKLEPKPVDHPRRGLWLYGVDGLHRDHRRVGEEGTEPRIHRRKDDPI